MGRILRFLVRLIWFPATLLWNIGDFLVLCLRCAGNPPRRERALWLQRCARRILPVFRVIPHVMGLPPNRGLLVCNHLSYLDIPVLAAVTPAVFVAKAEVRSWPVFGWFALLAGTLFLHRTRRADVGRVGGEISGVLRENHLVVLFAEGTSSDGSSVLPFRSSLFEPLRNGEHPVYPASVDYELRDGSVARDVCYWGEMTLLPHLLKLMTKRGVTAYVRFSELEYRNPDRKALARELHAEVIRLRALPRNHASPVAISGAGRTSTA